MNQKADEIVQLLRTINLEKPHPLTSRNPYLRIGYGDVFEVERRQQWESIRLAWRNTLTAWLSGNARPAFRDWNKYVLHYESAIDSITESLISKLKTADSQVAYVSDTIKWDLISIVMEAVYSEICPLSIYTERLLPFYLHGALPCGWHGKWPSGMLEVTFLDQRTEEN